MQIDKKLLISSIKSEVGDINDAYEQDPKYRDGVLEGLRLAVVLINEQLATAEKIRLWTEHRPTRKVRH
jgi:hypothetical protein